MSSPAAGFAHSPRHTVIVRVTHWVAALCVFALLLSGVEILISHPRFYWGEAGNALSPPLFVIPIPASRGSVPTGYGFVLPDQNGWSRYLHFQTAWLIVFTGLVYVAWSLVTGHFSRNLVPAGEDASWRRVWRQVVEHARFRRLGAETARAYNVLQRVSYLLVIFGLLPMLIWTGLAMSPAIASAFPLVVTAFGGQQSARTIHFFLTVILVMFVGVHIGMVWLAGFGNRMRAMITGSSKEQA